MQFVETSLIHIVGFKVDVGGEAGAWVLLFLQKKAIAGVVPAVQNGKLDHSDEFIAGVEDFDLIAVFGRKRFVTCK